MGKKEVKFMGNALVRFALVAVALLIQAAWLAVVVLKLNDYSNWISLGSMLLAAVVVLRLNSKHTNSAMKMPWIMLILILPVMGLTMYVLFVLLGDPGVSRRLEAVRQEMSGCLEQDPGVLERMAEKDEACANESRYLWHHGRSPVYENTAAVYYGRCVDALEDMKRDLEQAEHFIFMEYFIIEDTSAFRELEEILVRKASQGVEVRLMYDDFGCMGYVNLLFARRLNGEGIHCRPFNPAVPVMNLFMNHRDHRKITVIDGKVGYTGGYNLAEAYFDRARPYGLWKDSGLRLEGEAVRSLTAMFLELWAIQSKEKEDHTKYLSITSRVPARGFVQPFGDDPLGTERMAENVYLNLTSQATRSLYFMTPYLIITDELSRALCLAAKRGVDVRIITPGIPDKKTVFAVTRSYYAAQAREGVRIYEYTPGFCHAKQCICDGKIVSIGTSNLDYRSLYHHFENNVLLYDCEAVEAVAKDFEELFPQCREVTRQYSSGRGAMLRTWQYILRLFAPLM